MTSKKSIRLESRSIKANVVYCKGLRRVDFRLKSAKAGSLAPVKSPVKVSNTMSSPLVVFDHTKIGRVALVSDGKTLSSVFIDKSPAPTTRIGQCRGVPRRAAAISAQSIAIMTDRGPEIVDIDPVTARCSLRHTLDNLPALTFEVYSEMQLTADVGSRKLSGSYSSTSARLDAADSEALKSDLVDAYGRLTSMAAASKLHTQPTLARYRLLDASGATVHLSNPVILNAAGGFQAAGEFHCALSADFSQRQSTVISATTFKVRLRGSVAAQSYAASLVDQLLIELSEPIHPVDASADQASRISRRAANDYQLYFRMPGTGIGMSQADDRLDSLTLRHVEAHDRIFLTAATIRSPFSSTTLEVDVDPLDTGDWAAQKSRQAKAIATTPARTGRQNLMAMFQRPNRFTAAVCASSGDLTLWGNLASLESECCTVESLAAKFDGDVNWTAVVSVIAADSTVIASQVSQGSTKAPSALNPLIFHNSPTAARLTVQIKTASSVKSATVNLAPSANRSFAYYLSPGLKPIELAETSSRFVVPEAVPVSHEFSGYVAVTSSDDPFNPIDVVKASTGVVTAIADAGRRSSSWESTARRFYVFTDRETRLIGVRDSMKIVDLGQIDRRGVDTPTAVAVTTDDDFPVAAIAAGDLIGLSRGTVTTLLSAEALSAAMTGATPESVAKNATLSLGWDVADRALYIADHDGSLFRVSDLKSLTTKSIHSTGIVCDNVVIPVATDFARLAFPYAKQLTSTSCGLLISTADALLDTSRPDTSDDVEIEIRFLARAPFAVGQNAPARLHAVTLPLFASKFNGKVEILALRSPLDFDSPADNPGARKVILEAAISRRVARTLDFRVFAPPMRYVAVVVKGQASPNAVIEPPRLVF